MVMSTFLLSASVYIQIPALSEWLPTVGLSHVETGAALGALGIGGRVNLEADLIGAYVRRALGRDELSLEQLIAAGFAD